MTSLPKSLVATCAFVVANASLALSVTVTAEPVPCGFSVSMATADPSGGVPPYSYLWNTGATTVSIILTTPGLYTCTVTDSEGTTATGSGIAVPLAPSFHLAVQNVLPACGGCDGEVLLDTLMFNGVSPYTIMPTPNFYDGSVAHFTGLCPFEFSITVTDGTGCMEEFGLPIGTQAFLNAQVVGTTPGCNGSASGSVELAAWFENVPLDYYNFDLSILDGGGSVVAEPSAAAGTLSDPYYITVGDLVPGDYTAHGSFIAYCDPAVFDIPFTIPDMGPDCGTVQGVVWYDLDQDCTLEASESRLPSRVHTILPGPQYAITDGLGRFNQSLDYGSYTIQQNSPDLGQVCPTSAPVAFTLDASNQNVMINFGDTSNIPFDLETDCYMGVARPGFDVEAYVRVENRSIYASGLVTVAYTYATELQFVSADIAPSVELPGYLEWQLPVINGYGSRSVHAIFSLPPDPLLLGTVLTASAVATNDGAESNTLNNICSSSRTITGSYDPNFKEAHTSSGIGDLDQPYLYFPIHDDWIDYTVHFQNTGTAAAETVVVRDLIDVNLSIPSLEILSASHAFAPSFSADEPRELVFTFTGIDLPDSTSDLLGSQGFLRYRIKPLTDVLIGTTIENTANIFFDFNPAIVTNTTQHIVSLTVGIPGLEVAPLRVFPNPAQENVNIVSPLVTAFEVLSVDGRRIQVPSTRRADGFLLDVRTLAQGTYVIRTSNGTARFVKR